MPATVHDRMSNAFLSMSSLLTARDKLDDRTDAINKSGRANFWLDPILLESSIPPEVNVCIDLPDISNSTLDKSSVLIMEESEKVGRQSFNLLKWLNKSKNRMFHHLNDELKNIGEFSTKFNVKSGIDGVLLSEQIIEQLEASSVGKENDEIIDQYQSTIQSLVGIINQLTSSSSSDFVGNISVREGLLYMLEGNRLIKRYRTIHNEIDDGKANLTRMFRQIYNGQSFQDHTMNVQHVKGSPLAGQFDDLLNNDFFRFIKSVSCIICEFLNSKYFIGFL